jgi:hypothetical protein
MTQRLALFAALIALAAILIAPAQIVAGPIAPGDLLVYQAGDATHTTATTGLPLYILELNPSTPSANPVQTWDISTQNDPLYTTGAPSGTGGVGVISLSDNNTEISFTGWTSTASTGNLQSTQGIPRGVGVINANGVYSQPASYNPATLTSAPVGTADDFTHTAYSPDGVNWFFGDSGGIYYNNGSSPIPTTLDTPDNTTGNFDNTSIKSFGSNTYDLHGYSIDPPLGGYSLSTTTPATLSPSTTNITYSQVFVPSSGPEGDAPRDFTMLSSADNGTYDTAYIVAGGTLSKYALIAGTWTKEGMAENGSGTYAGIAAAPAADGGVDLYLTLQHNDFIANPDTVDEITDSAAFDAELDPSSAQVLYTAPSGVALDGVSLAPTVPEPFSLAALPAIALLILPRRPKTIFRRR